MPKDRIARLQNFALALEVKAPGMAFDMTKQETELLRKIWSERNPDTELVFEPKGNNPNVFYGYVDWRKKDA